MVRGAWSRSLSLSHGLGLAGNSAAGFITVLAPHGVELDREKSVTSFTTGERFNKSFFGLFGVNMDWSITVTLEDWESWLVL